MRPKALSPLEALASLHSGTSGLDPGEAQRKLVEFGLNKVERVRKKHLVRKLVEEFVHFFGKVFD